MKKFYNFYSPPILFVPSGSARLIEPGKADSPQEIPKTFCNPIGNELLSSKVIFAQKIYSSQLYYFAIFKCSFMFKVKFLLSAVACFMLVLNSHAKIWRVNNNSSVTADFTTLSAAIASSNVLSGDTIHLEPSPDSYGSATIAKKVIIIGNGYYLDENLNLQAVPLSSKADAITFNHGAQGSVLLGIDFRSNNVNIYCNDIVVRRCKFAGPSGSTPDWSNGSVSVQYHSNAHPNPANNIIISENYGVIITVSYASTGVLITNNFIAYNAASGDATTSACLSLEANAVALVKNNIFRRGRITANNSSFTNNIMFNGSFVGTANLVSNNLANAAQFGSGNSNLSNVDMSTVFVGTGTGVSTDGQWKLKPGSPAIGAGFGSTPANPIDAGMYGGSKPYVLAGIPPLPSIYSFTNQPVGSNTDPIDVTIKVRSNN